MNDPRARLAHVFRIAAAAALFVLVAACSNQPTQPAPPPAPTPPPRQLPPQPPITQQERARMHTDLAAGYYERGQMDVAIDELNNAVKLDPAYAPAYNIYGLVYSMLGDDARAQQNFARALELAPTNSEIHHNWGWWLCQHKREREALTEFETAVSNPLYRTPEIALVNAGRCAQSIGEVRAAEGYYRRALAAQPGNALASYGLALLAYKEARYDDSRNWMRTVMQTTNPAPEALYLGVCVERKLGDRQAEMSYISQLRNRYPDSAENKAVANQVCE